MGEKGSKEKGKGDDKDIEELKANTKIGALLRTVPLLSSLTSEQRALLGGALVEKTYSDGELIIKQGDEGLGFFIIKEGEVIVYQENESKVRTDFGKLKKDDYFGETALLTPGAKRNASVAAIGSVSCFYLANKFFETLFVKQKEKFRIKFAKRKAVAADAKSGYKKPPPGATKEKDEKTEALIMDVVKRNILFENLEPAHQQAIVKEMYRMEIKKGVTPITQGDPGDNVYVVESGNFDVFVDGKKVFTQSKGSLFGDLALLYNAPRKATVTASEDSVVWVVDRYTFRRIVTDLSELKMQTYVKFLKKVELLTPLAEYEREKIAEALEEIKVKPNEVIFNQGEEGKDMYIVYSGEVIITKSTDGKTFKEVARCVEGQAFGERALLRKEPRAATATAGPSPVELLKVDRITFDLLLGPLEDIMKRTVASFDEVKEKTTVPEATGPKKIAFEDLKVIGTLGKGAFGHVQLVQDKNTSKTYALKAVSKQLIVQTGQQGHIMSEKRAMEQLDHPFIIKLYQTFKDKDRLYFLLEPSLGGDLFGILREKTLFDENYARFYAACVISAFEYMHSKNIIYRDLKPENLLIDKDGYLKVTDFGFAKDISGGRTWTLCGTPDYLAPEIVAGKGHGKGVDWWTVGVFIYEMLASYAPFYDEDPMKTYEKIVHGDIAFPSHFSKDAINLIKKLLNRKPIKRLGVTKGGAKSIKKHPWFKGFDWDLLYERKLSAPILPVIKSAIDMSNIDEYQGESEEVPEVEPYVDDGTDWDKDF